MVMWSKIFDHDHGQNFEITMVKWSKFRPRPWPTSKIFMAEMVNLKFGLEIKPKNTHFDHDHGQNTNFPWSKWLTFDLTTKFEHKMNVLTIDYGGNSRVSVVMVKFFDH